ncbi:RING-type E3 ubiquitin transferase [Caenorhabditis elegans]|uniref:RING-type E3 ubiquitin transferase n=3 Tax=Caenorhabditis elegans TaxID=6239 RepID=A0A1T5HUG1_CAEEL|nr:RING-type domain-containing protein [Caenorhabditis elegans]SKC30487.1 RING-type domain-containing protein [Caenorhabditis elegans]|eukprot:NP_001337280.1 Uncharacterized protein CELE_H05L14.2 [Caenorhabditis elegans]
MGNIPDKLLDSPSNMGSSDSESNDFPSENSEQCSVSSADKGISSNSQTSDVPKGKVITLPDGTVCVSLTVKISEEESHKLGELEAKKENDEQILEPSTSVLFERTAFPPVDSRSPTSRFPGSKKSNLITRLNVNEIHSLKKSLMDLLKQEKMSQEQRDDSDVDDEESSVESSESPCTSSITISVASPTDPEAKRQKKKEKKKARQLSKEQQIKKQRLERAEAAKQRELNLAEHKRHLAKYAALVAKPTVVKTDEQPNKKSTQLQPRVEKTEKMNISVVSSDEQKVENRTGSFSSPSSTRLSNSSNIPSCFATPDSPDSQLQSFVSNNSDLDADTSVNLSITTDGVHLMMCVDKAAQGVVVEATHVGESENTIEVVEDAEKSFEILVCGQRRKVTPFTPRRKQDSSSGDEQPASESTSAFDIPEHPPVIVPFRNAPIVYSSQTSNIPQIHPPLPPPRFLAMPMQFSGHPPPVIMGPPIIRPFGAPPPQFIPIQSNYGRPPQFPPIGVVPIPIQRLPMQRMSGPPVMMSRGPVYCSQPVPMHPMQQNVQNMQSSSRQDFGMNERLLIRPNQKPLEITAPPVSASNSSKIEKMGKVKRPEPRRKEIINVSRVSQVRNNGKDLDQFKTQKDTVPETRKPINECKESEKSDIVVAKDVGVVEQSEIVSQPENSKDLSTSANKEETSIVEQVAEKSLIAEKPDVRRSSSIDLNGDLIEAVVATVLDDSDDESPIPSTSVSSESVLDSTQSEAQQDAINRVLGFSKQCEETNFSIWTGFENECPEPVIDINDNVLAAILEPDEEPKTEEENDVVTEIEDKARDFGEFQKPTLLTICQEVEAYFSEHHDEYVGSVVDDMELRKIFKETYGGSIPEDHKQIIEEVCSFQPGYIHVFDALIGSKLEFTYTIMSNIDRKIEKENDRLYQHYSSRPAVDGVENFYERFEKEILPEVLPFISGRFISIRTFVSIVEVVKDNCLDAIDLYYLAALVFGTRPFFSRFNGKIKQLHIFETAGKRWISRPLIDEEPRLRSSQNTKESRMVTVLDFLNRLRPHIDDILQVLPDTVVNGAEFLSTAKLVCGWHDDHEERIWNKIVHDRSKFQEFYEAYKPFLRIEIRMGTIYLRKLTYEDDDVVFGDGISINMMSSPYFTTLKSVLKTDESIQTGEKKNVKFAAIDDLIVHDAPHPTDGYSNRSTQSDNFEMNQIWDLEKEVIRQLKRDNITFAEFIKSEDAREMHQFLADTFKKMDLKYFAFILEKAMVESREQSWKDTIQLRLAAEEAHLQLDLARGQFKKEFGDLRARMETISRFETFEVQVSSESRIEQLQGRIDELIRERNNLVKEEIKEEKALMERQINEMKAKHLQQTRKMADEILRLKQQSAQLATARDELLRGISELDNNSQRSAPLNIPVPTAKEFPPLHRNPQPETVTISIVSSNIASCSSSPSPPTSPTLPILSEARRQLKLTQKFSAEFDGDELRFFARDLFEWYNSTKANHKERKTAEKQLKEYEVALDCIECAIHENLEMLKLGVVENLRVVPDVPMPFSETVMKKMFQCSGYELDVVTEREEVVEEEDGCLICTEIIEEAVETVTCDTCTREYHYHCISRWLKINSVCPQCSRALKDPNEYPCLE